MTTETKATCGKCNGTGRIDAFAHIHNGRCFCCGGTGVVDANSPHRQGNPQRGKTIAISGAPAWVTIFGDMFRISGQDGEIDIDAAAARVGRVEIVSVSTTWQRRSASITREIAAQLR